LPADADIIAFLRDAENSLIRSLGSYSDTLNVLNGYLLSTSVTDSSRNMILDSYLYILRLESENVKKSIKFAESKIQDLQKNFPGEYFPDINSGREISELRKKISKNRQLTAELLGKRMKSIKKELLSIVPKGTPRSFYSKQSPSMLDICV